MSTTPESDSPQTPSGPQCAACKTPLGDSYYQANDVALCENCAANIQQSQLPKGSRGGRLAKAVALGILAAAAGAFIQYLVLHFFDINAALVTILIGFMVGTAVRSGSGGRGGWRYQIIAVVLTYLAIGAAYVPLAIAELSDAHDRKEKGLPPSSQKMDPQTFKARKVARATPALAAEPAEPTQPVSPLLVIGAIVFGLFALPISVGMSNPLSILIFGFGLYQAWKMNKATPITITGPHWRASGEPPLPAT